MDLVYIVKESDENDDLRYSLRSVEKFVPYDNIWIVGYKPKWVKNVNYIPVKQSGNKWNNSVKNILTACKCDKISENFVLMNDDFFAIKPISNLEESINVTLGLLKYSIKKHKPLQSRWGNAFQYLQDLLRKMKIREPYYDYESHIPLMINRKIYLEVMDRQEVKDYMKTSKVLHKRSLYKNCSENTYPKILEEDVKIEFDRDVIKKIKVCDWLSVFDNQVNKSNYKRLNFLLQSLFPEKSKFETDNFKPVKVELPSNDLPKKRVVINPDGSRVIKEY